MLRAWRLSSILFLVLSCLAARTWAATPVEPTCGVPQLPVSGAPNIFNDEQQVMLGDIMADLWTDRMEAIDDPAVTAYLQALGERIVRHLPPSHLQYRFLLADMPIANAMSMAGGRVYVTRKLVASARSEDELAGVIGHELGHIITHQPAVDWTQYMNKALGVTSVSDRKDIQEKVDRVFQLRNLQKLGNILQKKESEQREADRVGMEALILAGYRPEAYAEIFDRVLENKGKTGSWLSELFGTTAPLPKRYREILKLLPKLPSGCVEAKPAGAEEEFQAWKKKVAEYRGTGRQESLHGVALKRELTPALQPELRRLRFSPDGKYFLAQDNGTVWVARREPPQVLFQFPAPDAAGAMFSADSSEVVVYDAAMRIERWDVASLERTEVYEVSTASGCVQFTVSPDGNTLACLEQDVPPGKNPFEVPIDLVLIDTESNEAFFERKAFHHPTMGLAPGVITKAADIDRLRRAEITPAHLQFSPDGRYFLAGTGTSKPVAYDLKTRSEVALPEALAGMVQREFAFVGSDRVAGVAQIPMGKGMTRWEPQLVRFPGGELVSTINTGFAQVTAAARGNYLLLRPVKDCAVGVLDLSNNVIVRANKKPAFDVYDDTCISELGNGEIGLFREGTTPIATLKLPRGNLGRLEAVSVSPDLHWLAVSEAGRGAVWDLKTGEQLYNVKGFQGSHIDKDGSLYVDFPAQDKTPRNLVRLGLESRGMGLAQSLEKDESATEHGAYLARVRPIESQPPVEPAKQKAIVVGKGWKEPEEARYLDVLQQRGKHVLLEVKDTRNGKLLWSRRFEHEMPQIDVLSAAGTMVLSWMQGDEGAKAAMKQAHGERGYYLLEVMDAGTGGAQGTVLVPALRNLFEVAHAYAAGERVFVADTRHRVIVYSLKDGRQLGYAYGLLRAITADGSRFCVQPQRGRLAVYDGATLAKVDEFSFSHPASYVGFTTKGLFVLTSNQTVYGLEMP